MTTQQTITLEIHCSRFGVSNTPEDVECAHSVHTHTHTAQTHTHTHAHTHTPHHIHTHIHTHTHTQCTDSPRWVYYMHTPLYAQYCTTNTHIHVHKVGTDTHKHVSCKPSHLASMEAVYAFLVGSLALHKLHTVGVSSVLVQVPADHT